MARKLAILLVLVTPLTSNAAQPSVAGIPTGKITMADCEISDVEQDQSSADDGKNSENMFSQFGRFFRSRVAPTKVPCEG